MYSPVPVSGVVETLTLEEGSDEEEAVLTARLNRINQQIR
jgi:hypothetical protein